MILERFPELLKLSDAERLQLCTELSDTLFVDEPVDDPALVALLDERYRKYLANPESARPAQEVLAQLRAKYIEPKKQTTAETQSA